MNDNRPFWLRRTFWGFTVLFVSYAMVHFNVMASLAPLIEKCAYALIGYGMYKRMGRQ